MSAEANLRAVGVSPEEPPATNVVEALRRVMRDLPGIGRDTKGQQYAYRGIEQITKEAQPLLAKHGVVFAPRVTAWHEPTQITVNSKPWTDERLEVTYRVYGPGGSEDFIEVSTVGIGRDNSDKGSNKAMTQAFKYALLQVLMVADSKDDSDSTTHEADDWGTRPEIGNPTRVATLRADVRPSDVARMRLAEVRDRLVAADLSPAGTLGEQRARLVEYLERSSAARVNEAGPAVEGVLPLGAETGAGTALGATEAAVEACFAEGCPEPALPGSEYCVDHSG